LSSSIIWELAAMGRDERGSSPVIPFADLALSDRMAEA
jgi:hypothetical protein